MRFVCMGEKIKQRREKKKLLISLLIATLLLVGLIVGLILLNKAILSGHWYETMIKIFGVLRIFDIIFLVIDGFLILQWLFLLFFRTD